MAESAITAPCGQAELRRLECVIEYRAAGSDDAGNNDRGRQLAAMDSELLRITAPASAPKCDYTQTPAVALGTMICWSRPKLAAAKREGKLLTRAASLQLYFFAEGA